MIAPMVASRSSSVGFIVLLAAPGVKEPDVLLAWQEAMELRLGWSQPEMHKSRVHSEITFEIITNAKDNESAKVALTAFTRENYAEIPDYAIPPSMSKEQFVKETVKMLFESCQG